MKKRQIDIEHYEFCRYFDEKRWMSLWHQLREVFTLGAETVLEIGPGAGVFKVVAEKGGLSVTTVDVDPALDPDHVASAAALPFENDSYDCVCAFQVLEHLAYEQALVAFREMVRVARSNVVISIPDAKKVWSNMLYVPKIGHVFLHVPKPCFKNTGRRIYDGHYWEINKSGYSLNKVLDDLTRENVKLLKTYRPDQHKYHRFFIFSTLDK